ALAEFVSLDGNIRTFVKANFASEGGAILLSLPLDMSSVPDQAQWLVEHCLVSRWTHTPSLMEQLLSALVTLAGAGSLAPLRERVRQRIDPNPDLFQT